MPLTIQIKGRYAAPTFVCDHCKGEITEGHLANYTWQVNERGNPVTGNIFYTHKKCCAAFEERNGGRGRWCADELSHLPTYINLNLKIDEKKAKANAELLSSI